MCGSLFATREGRPGAVAKSRPIKSASVVAALARVGLVQLNALLMLLQP